MTRVGFHDDCLERHGIFEIVWIGVVVRPKGIGRRLDHAIGVLASTFAVAVISLGAWLGSARRYLLPPVRSNRAHRGLAVALEHRLSTQQRRLPTPAAPDVDRTMQFVGPVVGRHSCVLSERHNHRLLGFRQGRRMGALSRVFKSSVLPFLRYFATVFGSILAPGSASRAKLATSCSVARTARVVMVLLSRTCPMQPPTISTKGTRCQTIGSKT